MDRQRINESDYGLVVEDRCSGSVPFFQRPGGQKVKKLVDKGLVSELSCWQIDRLGRSLLDVLNTISYFTERGISIHFICQGLKTMDANGCENPLSRMVISMLGVLSEMEKNQIRERTMQGIAIAKSLGRYKGRQCGTSEDVLTFLSKPKNAKALVYLRKGFSNSEVARLVGLHVNTVSKIKKFGMQQRSLKAA
jgi:DNA invertase Pin-like site-specific DNA recombinase